MTIPTNILALIFVLSFLIVFHEGGHFLVAKLFKFPVEIFSLGFGKRLFGWKKNETDYRVSLIPLGGYVKVVGLGPDESDVVAGTAEASVTQPGTRLERLLILFAGPGVNLVLAFLLTALAFLIGVEVAKYKGEAPVVKVVDHGSPAERAGIQAGDRIATISGKPVRTWEEVELETGLAPREELTVGIERDGKPLTLRLTPEPRSKYDIGYTGLNPTSRPSSPGSSRAIPARRPAFRWATGSSPSAARESSSISRSCASSARPPPRSTRTGPSPSRWSCRGTARR